MQKIIYITIHQFENQESDGVAKKILGQVKAFSNLGYDVTYTGYNGGNIFIRNKREIKKYKRCPLIANRTSVYNRVIKHLNEESFDIAYIRGLSCDFGYLKVLRKLEKNKVKTIIEIPTYPREKATYKQNGLKGLLIYYWDKFLSKSLYKIKIDKFLAVGSPVKTLFGKPAYNIPNGIDIEKHNIRKYPLNNELHVVAVAHINIKHGYDRFIIGLEEYYKDEHLGKRKVYLHIVGSGTQELESLVNTKNLKDYVIFHGVLGGQKLDNILNRCQIALGALAIHRFNLTRGSVLKVKEYCARGIPFVVSYEEERLSGEDFCLQVPADETPINIKQLVEFEQMCSKNSEKLISRMREIAEKEFKWENILSKYL